MKFGPQQVVWFVKVKEIVNLFSSSGSYNYRDLDIGVFLFIYSLWTISYVTVWLGMVLKKKRTFEICGLKQS